MSMPPPDLYNLEQAPAAELMESARRIRRERGPRVITYSPKVFIPLTKLCRDVCHYCTFAQAPRDDARAYLTADEVLELARAGARHGCHEALFTLGDKPELRYRSARTELERLGFESTAAYLAHCCRLVLEETGLLPHVNAGILDRAELARLRQVSASVGLMLETASARLSERGGPHFGSPDKLPEVRIEMLAEAGRQRIPTSTGVLIGIGETRAERLASLVTLRDLHAEHGHLQEVLVQNFRAKPGTKMAGHPEPELEELRWSAAAARIVLGPQVSVQCPPNLSGGRFAELLDAGIDDWGGISPLTPDHVNPEAPWPAVERLRDATGARGFELAPRLCIYPRFARDPERWTDPDVATAVRRRSDAEGLARTDEWAVGRHDPLPARPARPKRRRRRLPSSELDDLLAEGREGKGLDEDAIVRLFRARGEEYESVLAAADELRREVCGDDVSYVVTRNVNYTNVCYFRCGFCAFSKGKLAENLRGPAYVVPIEEIVRRAREAWDRGAVEVCLQGGIHPGFDGDFYVSVCEAIKRELPDLHVHAFSALEVFQGAATLGVPVDDYLGRLRDAGLASLPGTAAEILDDEVRAILCPDKISTAEWLAIHEQAHRVSLRSTSTIMFGAVEGIRSWATHLLALRDQQRRSGGFTEFVPLPFVHMEAPIYARGRARPGPTFREAILMHAVARLALHPEITNIQASWAKLGIDGAQAALRAGANDLGGTLMNESISRAAGARHGQEMPPEGMEEAIRTIGRVPWQRTTLYGAAPARQQQRSFDAPALARPVEQPAREAGLRPPRRLIRGGAPAT